MERLAPPASFELQALDESALEAAPAPRPLADYEPFDAAQDAERFGRVDAHARQVAARRFGTLRELLYALVFRRGLADDFERVRYVFDASCSTLCGGAALRFGSVRCAAPSTSGSRAPTCCT